MVGRLNVYNHWAFLDVDHQVGKYYRRLFLGQFGLKLERPSNGEHITVISPEDTLDFDVLRRYNGEIFNFELQLELEWNGSAIWLPAISREVDLLRLEFNLSNQTFPLHFCIGYLQ